MLLVGVCTFLHDNCHQTQPQQQQEEKKKRPAGASFAVKWHFPAKWYFPAAQGVAGAGALGEVWARQGSSPRQWQQRLLREFGAIPPSAGG